MINIMNIKAFLAKDSRIYYPRFLSKEWLLDLILQSEQYWIRRFMIALRKEEYYSYIKPSKFLKYYYQRRKNILGRKLGFFIPAGCFDEDLKIYHYGSIIINPNAKIGKHCTIHGNCCIGSKGSFPDTSPIIGDNVDIGQGAQILGGVTIANGVKIGAGSIVTKDILIEEAIVVGIPGRILPSK